MPTAPSTATTPSQPSSAPSASATRPPTSPTAGPTTGAPTPSATATGMPHALPGWLDGSVITRLPTAQRVIALTFDGGSGAQGAPAILAALQQARVPATLFLTGQFAANNPQLVSEIVAAGYLIGNHTMTHPHLGALSRAAVVGEIRAAERQLRSAAGVDPRPWFRFPFGEYTHETLDAVQDLGYGAIGWTIDTRGWQGRTAGDAADVVSRVRAGLEPGAIVLMHLGANPTDGTTFDADALPGIIAAVRAAGYGFVDLADVDRR